MQPENIAGSEKPWMQWGTDLDDGSVRQMRNACLVPVAVRGALMPDAHTGYGMPIGGVLAVRGAVIPYAVGMDIACRMKMTVCDLPPTVLKTQRDRLAQALEGETAFGVGSGFRERRRHRVMDADWSVSPVTDGAKDQAWKQLGSSGAGNHFVEFGLLTVTNPAVGLAEGVYVALLSHSGSRGVGADVATHYSRLALSLHPELSGPLRELAWLDLDSDAGQEYWAAMELMGEYAAANHQLIHHAIARRLGLHVILDIENHHNFAWQEDVDGETLIVHRKGATPAHAGVIGIIPGSMATPGYVVRGLGSAESLNSAAHGAGRRMSRAAARRAFSPQDLDKALVRGDVEVLSAGLDEAPMAYKCIERVMAEQADLVEPLARFDPKLVKMAPPEGRRRRH
jgi:tRNA-splicing ligase RtcB